MVERAAVLELSQDGIATITWAGLRVNDTGDWVRAGRYADKTIQVIVAAAGAGDAVTIQGSPDEGTTIGDCHGAQGELLQSELVGATIKDPELIAESPVWIRPNIEAGDATTNLTVVINMPTRGK